ncbi:glycosyltransferase [Halalkalibaculum sp. DA3122]|uniref:glycosyltransferase n=1 Tax=unclassified Halalkalibaculum TaxID=2964617 RepID=UPI00375489D0
MLSDEKKILIISSSFYPVNSPRSFRATELVKEFARQGHDVTLLTLKNDRYHIPFEEEFGVTIKDLGDKRLPDIDMNGTNGITTLFKRALRRGALQLFEYPNIELAFKVKRALKNEAGYDLLISIAVPHPIHWGVAWAWDEKDPVAGTWVADCGDPYMGAVLDSFNKMFYFKYVEKYFCNKADFITVPIEDAKEGYYPEFRDKIRVIPQGFQFEAPGTEAVRYREHAVPTFAYAGGFIPGGRDPRAFLDYLTSIGHPYKFIVYTRSRSLVEPYVERSAGTIEIRDYIPRSELLKVLSTMDFLVNFENSTSLQRPSKLIDYYLAGRPVLSVTSSDIDKNAINEFLSGNYTRKYEFGDMDQFRIENVCRNFLDLCQQKVGV